MRLKIIILMGHSLYADGLISRLHQYGDRIDLQIMDLQHCDVLGQIIAAHPTVVILDETDPEVVHNCSLTRLLTAVPTLKVIRLDPQTAGIQVIQWEQHQVREVRELVDTLLAPLVEPPQNSITAQVSAGFGS